MFCVIISLYFNIIFPWLVSGHTLEGLDVQNDNMTKTSQTTNNTYTFILTILIHYYMLILHVILLMQFYYLDFIAT